MLRKKEFLDLFPENKKEAVKLYDFLPYPLAVHEVRLIEFFKAQLAIEDRVLLLKQLLALIDGAEEASQCAALMLLLPEINTEDSINKSKLISIHSKLINELYSLSLYLSSTKQLFNAIQTFSKSPQYLEKILTYLPLLISSHEDFIGESCDLINALPTIGGVGFLNYGLGLEIDFLSSSTLEAYLSKLLYKTSKNLTEDDYLKLIVLMYALAEALNEAEAKAHSQFAYLHCDHSKAIEVLELWLEYPNQLKKLLNIIVRIQQANPGFSFNLKLFKLLLASLQSDISEKILALQRIQSEEEISEEDLKNFITCLEFINEEFCHLALGFLYSYLYNNLEASLEVLKKISPESSYYPQRIVIESAVRATSGELFLCDEPPDRLLAEDRKLVVTTLFSQIGWEKEIRLCELLKRQKLMAGTLSLHTPGAGISFFALPKSCSKGEEDEEGESNALICFRPCRPTSPP